MQEQVIICPKCGHRIPWTEAISNQIKEGLRQELQQEFVERAQLEKKKIESEAKRKAEEAIAIKLTDLREQVKEKDEKLQKAAKAELKLRKQWRELDEKQKAFELEMERERETLRKEFDEQFAKKVKLAEDDARQTAQKRFTTELEDLQKQVKERDNELLKAKQVFSDKEKEFQKNKEVIEKQLFEKAKKAEEEARRKAKKEVGIELQDLQERVKEAEEEAERAKKKELDIRKRERELERKQKDSELEMARRVDEEKKKAIAAAVKTIEEEHRLKDLEKQKRLNDMKKQIEDLKRKAEQGSQQTQGEVFELELEGVLNANFPEDDIKPVPKGIRGADLLQNVYEAGKHCGTIVWESKRTKAWQKRWIEKLKDDQRKVKGEVAVLLTTVLPKDVSGFSLIDGVWVTDYSSVVSLTCALRLNLIDVSRARQAAVGRGKKMEILYDYLSGPEFRQRVEALAEAFDSMIKDLEQEKRAMTRIWAKREKQIRKIGINTAGMYGDMQGIIGASLPQIESLELKALTASSDSEADES
jgi:hypothetical protein